MVAVDQNLRFCDYKISPEISSLFTRCVTVSSLVFLEPQEFFLCQPLYPHLTHNIFHFLPPAPIIPELPQLTPFIPPPKIPVGFAHTHPDSRPPLRCSKLRAFPLKIIIGFAHISVGFAHAPRAVKINFHRICTYPSSLT